MPAPSKITELTMDELRQHRRLRLKITLDVNLLS